MNGSLGLRRIIDTWLLQRQRVNMETVKAELEQFKLWRFHGQMVKLSRVTMGEAETDENSELLLTHAFRYGIYGSDKSYKAGRIAAMGGSIRSGKLKSATAAIFLPYKRMKAQFPVLQKYPILLPFCWAKRILAMSRQAYKYKAKLNYRNISKDDYDEMKRFFEAGGVINSKE